MLSKKRTFLLLSIFIVSMISASSQELTRQGKNKTLAGSPVSGSGTPGQIVKWTGVDGTNSFTIGNSNIFEDKFGNVGIGTRTPTSLLTVQGMIETTMGGYKFPDGTVQTTAGISFVTHDASLAGQGTDASPLGIAPGGVQTFHLANGTVTPPKIANGTVVRSLNGLFDNVSLAAGSNITITPSGNTLTIASPSSLTSIAHDATLTGAGTSGSPLGVATGGVGNAQLANNAVTLSKIAGGQVVTGLNNLTDGVTLAAGSNITITPSGNTLTVAAAASSSDTYHQSVVRTWNLDPPGQVVISKQVPPGSYIIFFDTSISTNALESDPQDVTCQLSTGHVGGFRVGGLGDIANRLTLSLHDAATFPVTTTITVHCSGFHLESFNASLTALKVDSIQ